jgi:hypothetical protein
LPRRLRRRCRLIEIIDLAAGLIEKHAPSLARPSLPHVCAQPSTAGTVPERHHLRQQKRRVSIRI